MAVSATQTRVFNYKGSTLPDIPGKTPEEVRDIHAAAIPELATADIKGPAISKHGLVYEFKESYGTKG